MHGVGPDALRERELLLSLMRRVRRRRRSTAALEGAAFVLTGGALALTMAMVFTRTSTNAPLSVGPVSVVLVILGVSGAAARALRRIPLQACARSLDRVIASSAGGARAPHATGGDGVLAAVSFAEDSSATTPFVQSVVAEATTRIMGVNLRRAVPPPRARGLVLATGAMALLVVSGTAPLSRSRALDKPVSRLENEARSPALVPEPRIRLSGDALDAELEELRLAHTTGRDAGDAELTRLADEFQRVLSELSKTGLGASTAVMRLQELADTASGEAQLAAAAKRAVAAAATAATTSGSARNVGQEAAALGTALSQGASVAGAAESLAGHGEGGRAVLGKAAQAAATALADANIGSAASDFGAEAAGETGQADDEPNPRRLARPSESSSRSDESRSTDPRLRNRQRHLEQLRRDLDESASACRENPQACQQRARGVGRALGELEGQGRTSEARKRLAEAVSRFLERIRRTGASPGDSAPLKRFARSARGLDLTRPALPADPTSSEARRAIRDGQEGDSQSGSARGGEREGGDGQSESANAAGQDESSTPDNPGRSGGDIEGSGAATIGGGIGSQPGGRVLGVRAPGGTGAGRDAPMSLRTDAPGPSRAETIAGAAGIGFAATAYRKVFADYRAAVEESLDATAVPPGRRYLVRRYFQLIRPRLP